MPRRRAVRIIGVSLAVAAVPGIRPAKASAKTEFQAAACTHGTGPNPYQNACEKNLPPSGKINSETYCCGPPKWQFGCGDPVKGDCANSCPATIRGLGGKLVHQYPCTATAPDAQGVIRGKCCVRPEGDGCLPDGECRPNCPYLHLTGQAPGPNTCGQKCCATFEVCKNGKCHKCEDFGEQSCQPAKPGATICCKKGTDCCFNNTSTACCGPKQTCKTKKGATCVCEEGKKCGTDCCEKGEICTGSECCSANRLCPTGQKTNTCCSGENDYCFFKADPDLVPLGTPKLRAIGICKEGCAPRNIAGRQCCGTGFKPNRGKTRCVPE